jgi:uncharacterized membrane protein
MLGPLSVALAGWFVYLLARRIAGDRHGALAVFLMVGVHPVAFPIGAFDSDLVQMPLMALAVLVWWHAVTARNPIAWIVLGVTCSACSLMRACRDCSCSCLLILTAASRTGRAALSPPTGIRFSPSPACSFSRFFSRRA